MKLFLLYCEYEIKYLFTLHYITCTYIVKTHLTFKVTNRVGPTVFQKVKILFKIVVISAVLRVGGF
jgi:hypothetical protein